MVKVADHPDLDQIVQRLLSGQRGSEISDWLQMEGRLPLLRRKQINDYYRRHLAERQSVAKEDPPAPEGAKILAIDIETAPAIAFVWGLWKQNVGLNQIVEDPRVLCFAAKWIGQDGVMFYSEHHDGHLNMVKKAHELMDEADILLHYNGTSFDVPHLQREFLEAGMPPTSGFQEIDLLKTCRKQFRFPSNKLQYVSEHIGLEGKIQNEGFTLWSGCLDGNEKSWEKMKEYNIQDVHLLEEAYEILQPWIPRHPNLTLISGESDERTCPRCTAPNALIKRGFHYTGASVFQRYQCKKCGGYSRDPKRCSTNEQRIS